MDQILGLVSGTTFNDNNWNTRSTRRKIFHTQPSGQFPLTGLLSMTETDWTDSPEFGWQEKNRVEPETLVAVGTGPIVPFTNTGTETPTASPIEFDVGDLTRLHVADTTIFRANQVLYVEALPTASVDVDLMLLVVSVVTAASAIEVRVLEAPSDDIINTTNLIDGATAGPVNAQISILGNANAEGALSGSGIFLPPYSAGNYTQIFRNAFSATGTAIKVPTDFDKTGSYRETAQDNLTEHMTGIEKAFLFGPKSVEYDIVENGDTVPRRTTGGIEHFLKTYEAANSVYRGGTGAAALTDNADEDKRIIRTTGGALSMDFFEQTLMERLFRQQSSKTFEKICMCGSGFLGAVNNAIRSNITVNKDMTSEAVYGMNITTWKTPFGIVHFKTHPLFNNSSFRRYDAFILDTGHLKYRPLKDRDTKRYKNRQANDEDRRKDEWLTEAGLEMRHPQAHMLIKNCRSFT